MTTTTPTDGQDRMMATPHDLVTLAPAARWQCLDHEARDGRTVTTWRADWRLVGDDGAPGPVRMIFCTRTRWHDGGTQWALSVHGIEPRSRLASGAWSAAVPVTLPPDAWAQASSLSLAVARLTFECTHKGCALAPAPYDVAADPCTA